MQSLQPQSTQYGYEYVHKLLRNVPGFPQNYIKYLIERDTRLSGRWMNYAKANLQQLEYSIIVAEL